eukprot:g63391.t1
MSEFIDCESAMPPKKKSPSKQTEADAQVPTEVDAQVPTETPTEAPAEVPTTPDAKHPLHEDPVAKTEVQKVKNTRP